MNWRLVFFKFYCNLSSLQIYLYTSTNIQQNWTENPTFHNFAFYWLYGGFLSKEARAHSGTLDTPVQAGVAFRMCIFHGDVFIIKLGKKGTMQRKCGSQYVCCRQNKSLRYHLSACCGMLYGQVEKKPGWLRTIGTIKGQTGAIKSLCSEISTHHDHSCLRLLVCRTVTVFSADKLQCKSRSSQRGESDGVAAACWRR